MLHEDKKSVVSAMKAELERAEVALFVDFTGLTVAEADALRGKLREADVKYQVMKNTLMKHAVAGTAYESATQWFKGTPTGVIIGYEDPVSPAKVTYEFLKKCKHLRVKGGVMDNKAITEQEVEALSKMPSREEMQGQLIGMILGVAGGLINQIKSPAGRIVGAVEAKAEADEAA